MSTSLDQAVSTSRDLPRWPLFLIGAPAAVAIWSGWVGLGGLCGFGPIHPLPGIIDSFQINTAITLPVGIEAYGSYALGAWLHSQPRTTARIFARNSAVGALILGMLGQATYHLLAAVHAKHAPWPVVVFVSCLPVITLGFGAALAHLRGDTAVPASRPVPAAVRVPRTGGAPVPVPGAETRPVPGAPARIPASAAPVPAVRSRDGAAGTAAARPPAPLTAPGLLGQFTAELAAGAPPSIRTIRSRLHVGQERAQQVQAALAAYLAGRPLPAGADGVSGNGVPAVAGGRQ